MFLKKLIEGLSTLTALLVISFMVLVQYLLIMYNGNTSIIYNLSLYTMPIVVFLSILWLYIWTFNPLMFFKILKRSEEQIDSYLEQNNIEIIKNEEKQTRDIIGFLKKVKDSITENKLKAFVVNIFVIYFIYITVVVSFGFAISFYGIYKIDPTQMIINVDKITLVHFLILSLRTLFFSDYNLIQPKSLVLQKLILIQSFAGVSLFVILIMTFSTISVDKVKDCIPKINRLIQFIINKLEYIEIKESIEQVASEESE